jgi:dTDP-glucose 4,6-dehydratase
VPTLLNQALRDEKLTVFGDGKQTRSFCYISDLVEGILRVMNSSIHLPINLGNPRELTILQFAQIIRNLVNRSLEIEYEPLPTDDPKVRRPDISLAKRELGWEPKVGLEEGLQETLKYFRLRV